MMIEQKMSTIVKKLLLLYICFVIKYYWKVRDQRSKSVLLVLPPDATQNNPTSIINHLQSCHFLWFFILCATEFQGAHLPCSHVNLSAFLKHYSTYLQDNGKNRIMWCGPRLRPNFLKWPEVQKVWPPLFYVNRLKT